MKIKRNKLKEVFIIETTKKEMIILILLVIVTRWVKLFEEK